MHEAQSAPRTRRAKSAKALTIKSESRALAIPLTEADRRLAAMQAFHDEFVVMAQELPNITKDGRIQLMKNGAPVGRAISYVSFENLLDVVMPILLRHGFRISFHGEKIDGEFWIRCVLRRGIYGEDSLWPVDREKASPAMNASQATGSGATYASRNAMMKLLVLNSHAEEDRDAEGAAVVKVKTITSKQETQLKSAMNKSGVPFELFAQHYLTPHGLNLLRQLPAKDFANALKACTQYVTKVQPPEEETAEQPTEQSNA